jgi:hypothetical protein
MNAPMRGERIECVVTIGGGGRRTYYRNRTREEEP